MHALYSLERSALRRIAAQYPDAGEALANLLSGCAATRRENTGRGFFTSLEHQAGLSPINLRSPLGDAFMIVGVLKYGMCCLVFLTDGYPTLLEGYSLGGEDTSAIATPASR